LLVIRASTTVAIASTSVPIAVQSRSPVHFKSEAMTMPRPSHVDRIDGATSTVTEGPGATASARPPSPAVIEPVTLV
jgi:hypothetical protein